MRLLQLNYFLNVAATQNISRSARILHVSQPSLSRSIHDLENELGVPLFIRNGHALALNEAGRRFAIQVRQGLTVVDNAVDSLHQFSTANAAHITLRFESSTAVLPKLLDHLHERLPAVQVHLMQSGFEQDPLLHYDFEFTTTPIPGNRNFHLLREEILIRFPAAQANPSVSAILPDQLARWPLIMTEPNPLREQVISILQQAGIAAHSSFVIGDRQTILGLVRAGQGICFMPQYSRVGVNVAGTVAYRFSPKPVSRDIYLSAPAQSMKLLYHAQVAAEIQNYFQSIQMS
ncbi:LysR family transcriptional regulator [Lacticaseibacillus chiayiensis]|uniref:LysR family transcriptional regulator n=1 Tax=Lacticaseibacillus chiayiensis TaxID=2100821 RepID=UPI003C7248A2